MAIVFKPLDELFAHEYQLTYISTDGHIDIGPYTYSVFHNYTIQEKQIIFQICEKYLPWEDTQEQEQWERTMYMYQYIIKSPPPFPYEEYPLSEEIIMAITWDVKIYPLDVSRKEVSIVATRTDSVALTTETHTVISALLDTQEHKVHVLDTIWQLHLNYQVKQEAIEAYINDLEEIAKTNLEGREP